MIGDRAYALALVTLALISWLAARRYGWRAVAIAWVLLLFMLAGAVGTYIDLHLPE
jgi:uncharacterized phage infection (PIP) family protein YhgE